VLLGLPAFGDVGQGHQAAPGQGGRIVQGHEEDFRQPRRAASGHQPQLAPPGHAQLENPVAVLDEGLAAGFGQILGVVGAGEHGAADAEEPGRFQVGVEDQAVPVEQAIGQGREVEQLAVAVAQGLQLPVGPQQVFVLQFEFDAVQQGIGSLRLSLPGGFPQPFFGSVA